MLWTLILDSVRIRTTAPPAVSPFAVMGPRRGFVLRRLISSGPFVSPAEAALAHDEQHHSGHNSFLMDSCKLDSWFDNPRTAPLPPASEYDGEHYLSRGLEDQAKDIRQQRRSDFWRARKYSQAYASVASILSLRHTSLKSPENGAQSQQIDCQYLEVPAPLIDAAEDPSHKLQVVGDDNICQGGITEKQQRGWNGSAITRPRAAMLNPAINKQQHGMECKSSLELSTHIAPKASSFVTAESSSRALHAPLLSQGFDASGHCTAHSESITSQVDDPNGMTQNIHELIQMTDEAFDAVGAALDRKSRATTLSLDRESLIARQKRGHFTLVSSQLDGGALRNPRRVDQIPSKTVESKWLHANRSSKCSSGRPLSQTGPVHKDDKVLTSHGLAHDALKAITPTQWRSSAKKNRKSLTISATGYDLHSSRPKALEIVDEEHLEPHEIWRNSAHSLQSVRSRRAASTRSSARSSAILDGQRLSVLTTASTIRSSGDSSSVCTPLSPFHLEGQLARIGSSELSMPYLLSENELPLAERAGHTKNFMWRHSASQVGSDEKNCALPRKHKEEAHKDSSPSKPQPANLVLPSLQTLPLPPLPRRSSARKRQSTPAWEHGKAVASSKSRGSSREVHQKEESHVYLPSSSSTSTVISLRQGPIRRDRANISRCHPPTKEAKQRPPGVDPIGFQTATAYNPFSLSRRHLGNDAVAAESDCDNDIQNDLSEWFAGYRFEHPGMLVSEAAEMRRQKAGREAQVIPRKADAAPTTTNKVNFTPAESVPSSTMAVYSPAETLAPHEPSRQQEMTQVKWSSGLRLERCDARHQSAAASKQVVEKRVSKPSVVVDQESPPLSPMVDLVMRRSLGGRVQQFVPVPMGFNLHHDLGDFLAWESMGESRGGY